MMQTVLTITVIAAAVFYLAREVYVRLIKKDSSCDGCAFNAKKDGAPR